MNNENTQKTIIKIIDELNTLVLLNKETLEKLNFEMYEVFETLNTAKFKTQILEDRFGF